MIQYQLLCHMRDEELPESTSLDLAPGGAKKDVFKKERSIFAGFIEDTPKIMQKCFEYDKNFWKISRLTKTDEDYAESCNLLRRNYQWLKNLFISMCATSKYYPYAQMSDFVKYFSTLGILNQHLDSKSLDRIFLAANLSNTTIDYLGKYIKHQNMLTRTQFMECIARCAQNKFMLPSNIPANEKRLPVALRKFLEELRPKAEAIAINPQEFRELITNE
jgi:hypothetical protein